MALTDAPAPEPKPRRGIGAVLPYTTVALLIACLYVAWVFYSRYQGNKEAAARIAAEQEAKRQAAVHAVFGSGEIRFTAFSVDDSVLRSGQSTELCYGVENATTVTINPPIAPLKPTYHSCVEISPKKTTTYTITASDGKGHTESKSLTLPVR
jgi:hypothetical protein